MSQIALDAGALIALERNDRELWAIVSRAASRRLTIIVPTSALAEVWRGSPRQARLAQALSFCELAPFDPIARAVGELCGRAHTADICDAHVAMVAATGGGVLFTSDPEDMERLFSALRRKPESVVRC